MIEPAGYRVLVEPDAVEDSIPEELRKMGFKMENKREQDAVICGTLVKVGPTAWKEQDSPWAKEGDKVYFAKYGGHKIKDGEKEYRLLNDEDITAVVRD